jgi:hypothetical protein
VPAGSEPLDSVLGDQGAGGVIVVETAPGVKGEKDVYANVVSNILAPDPPDDPPKPYSVQGWSLSIAIAGDGVFSDLKDEFGSLIDITSAGTSSAPVTADPPGLQKGGFESHEIVDPAVVPLSGPLKDQVQGPGVVSAVVLSFKSPIVLPPIGGESVLKMKMLSKNPKAEGVDQVARLFLKDGLQGSGQPVLNVFTVEGATAAGCNTAVADVTLRFTEPSAPVLKKFVRGNANDDAKVNIADPIWVINELFREGDPSVCQDAADANNDGMVDSSDAVYLIEYLFDGGPTPPGPFPGCGTDPEDTAGGEDGVTCEVDLGEC